MTSTNNTVSRRTIAKGALWAAPVVAMGASAPALAASGGVPGQPGGPATCDTVGVVKEDDTRDNKITLTVRPTGGTVWPAGTYAVLTKPSGERVEKHANVGSTDPIWYVIPRDACSNGLYQIDVYVAGEHCPMCTRREYVECGDMASEIR